MSAAARKSRILIAGGDMHDAEQLKANLSALDCEIDFAVDGGSALDKVAEFHPDLIVLDIRMPKLRGFGVCRKLKDDPETRKIMILMVGALSELGDVERAVEAGIDDFLSNPVNKVELLSRVRNLLKLRSRNSD